MTPVPAVAKLQRGLFFVRPARTYSNISEDTFAQGKKYGLTRAHTGTDLVVCKV